ncbi:MAG: NADH-quinone oxidoreductase subunit NuoG [Candidatus Marinimicrobia bacterium]|nr:NADH-quinone oxidoreductase subunit NuoG [Candidatus Neomarinimicrobiota bacterium]MCF7830249.1 NADH-quinone oxidoreductase subunit NuoG [Candidatus Neomarinimicrobiota bacterium]MCF7882276.1 NADH-quinone oxidoreductase subunit NuoG [Candidatus Neomarinimicrobiota bacterium]
MPTIYIDDKPYEVKDGKNLLEAALSLGKDLPYFCWHPELGSVGACRQCAVVQFQDENDKQGRLVMACMTPASDGTRISIKHPEATQFRENVIEWLMVNHPHDCPVCDEGGECHLQDMTVMSGHNYRDFRFNKRTHRNQDLGPFINHEMNRCIACYRCVRYYRDYAGGDDLQAFATHDHVYFGRHEDGVLENEFSGNLVEVCPTGVFTDKTLKRHYTRKWDLQSAPSVCNHCGLGCNTIAGERYGTLRRILNRYNGSVNGYFLCDRGRFGYEFVNNEERVKSPLVKDRDSGEMVDVSGEQVADVIANLCTDKHSVIGIGSPRASLESNFALRTLVGSNTYFSGMTQNETEMVNLSRAILENGPARSASLKDVEDADAVLVLGEDLTNTAPMLALAVRQAVKNKPLEKAQQAGIPEWHDSAVRELVQDEHGPLFLATPTNTKLDDIATEKYNGAPQDLARFGYAIAAYLAEEAPKVDGLSSDDENMAKRVAQTLKDADHPVIISGTSLLNEALLKSAANVAWALCESGVNADLSLTVPDANSMGVSFLNGKGLEEAFEAARSNKVRTAIILESDLYRKASEQELNVFFDQVDNVVVIDHLETETTRKATILLPAGTFADSDGTFINNEGRAQRFFQVFEDEKATQESWRWLTSVLARGKDTDVSEWNTLDGVFNAMAKSVATFDNDLRVAPDSKFRIHGQKIPRSSYRYSGRTAMKADVDIHEHKPPEDPDSPLSFSMEGYSGKQPSGLTSYFWSPGWNSVQSTNKYLNEVGGEMRGGDPGIRLIVPNTKREVKYYTDIPEAFAPRENEWYGIPLHHIFGSEELSAKAHGVAKRIPDAYVAMNPASAEKLGLQMESKVTVKNEDGKFTLPITLHENLPDGVIGLPVGLSELQGLQLPNWTKIHGVSGS